MTLYDAFMSHEQSIGNVVKVLEIVGKVSDIFVTFSVPSPSRRRLLTFTGYVRSGNTDPVHFTNLSLKSPLLKDLLNWTGSVFWGSPKTPHLKPIHLKMAFISAPCRLDGTFFV